jgi:hypothetical protein
VNRGFSVLASGSVCDRVLNAPVAVAIEGDHRPVGGYCGVHRMVLLVARRRAGIGMG